MAEQPLNLIQVPPRWVLPQRALVTQVREQRIDRGQAPTRRRPGLTVDPIARQDPPAASGRGRPAAAAY
jgi:hypothetical protein